MSFNMTHILSSALIARVNNVEWPEFDHKKHFKINALYVQELVGVTGDFKQWKNWLFGLDVMGSDR